MVDRFYQAFARRDAAGMAACYHPQATFVDPAFGPLDRPAVERSRYAAGDGRIGRLVDKDG